MKKKALKILTVMFLVSIMLVTFSTVVKAGDALDSTKEIDGIEEHTGEGETEPIDQTGDIIIGVVQTVGTLVAVVIIVVLGIKYMKCSTEEKAAYKKTMIPYFVLAIVLFLGVTILRISIITFHKD